MEPLRRYLTSLEERRGVAPLVDPGDAGSDARVLVLLEAPGPMTNTANARPGSGFISVDNDVRTAENCWRARSEAGLIDGVLHWNIVPWYLGPASVKPNAVELAEGAAELLDLMTRLPRLRHVVLAGRYAQRGWMRHVAPTEPSVSVAETWHPSPLALNSASRREAFVDAMRDARRHT